MEPNKAGIPNLVLDLPSFQLVRDGQRVKLEKTPMELLTLLVRQRDALVTREEIVKSLWGDAVHVDVEAGINTAIRKIRQALDDDSASPRYLETVVGKGYRFVGPITVVGSEVKSAQTNSESQRGSRQWVWVALGGVGLLALLVLIRPLFHSVTAVSGNSQGRVVIAVVPLQNLSGDPGQDYFVDGLTDEILTQLGQLNPERLGVVKYGLSATAQQARANSADVSRWSEWQDRLEGSVRRNNDEVRVSVRLIRANDGTVLWTNSFDRHVGDVLDLQSEIAQRIGRELQVRILGHGTHKPGSPEVVEAYLRGRFELSRHKIPVPDAAGVYFERAIALDSTYAPAHAGLADFYRSRAVSSDEAAAQNWPWAEQQATEALSLDPENAEAHAALAQIRLQHDWDWPAAREHALRALQLNPSLPEAHTIYARYLRVAGNMSEAVKHRKQAVALDPNRDDLLDQLVLEYFLARDYQSGVEGARRIIANDAKSAFGQGSLCVDLGHLKQFDESVAECGKALTLDGHAEWIPEYMREYRQRGYEAANLLIARKELKDLLKRPHPDPWNVANAYADAGMKDEALRTLLQGIPTHDPGLLQIRVDPDFDGIRDDARYAELVRKIGFPNE